MKNKRKRGSKYSFEDKKRFVSLFKRSGLNRHRFALENGINYCTFLDWLKKDGPGDESATGFSEVTIQDRPEIYAEVKIGNGKSICFYQVPEVHYLKQLFSQ
jgi:transposase-like protein